MINLFLNPYKHLTVVTFFFNTFYFPRWKRKVIIFE